MKTVKVVYLPLANLFSYFFCIFAFYAYLRPVFTAK